MSEIPAASVQCCVTSPPYYGLRDYGIEGQIGLEPTVGEYVNRLVGVFREVRRVLRDDGTLWLNLGDSYASAFSCARRNVVGNGSPANDVSRPNRLENGRLKEKDLIGAPWSVAFALQADGWWLRDAIVWAKPNPMPSSVTDRCTSSYEMIFMLSKSARYYADMDAVREREAQSSAPRRDRADLRAKKGRALAYFDNAPMGLQAATSNGTANLRNVWTIPTTPYADAHFATFPLELPLRCIRIGTSEAGCCSACGASRVRVVELVGGRTTGRTPERQAVAESIGKAGNGANYGSGLDPADIADRVTRGFDPSCACDAPTVPSVVLDPFMGSGTTAEVAESLGRRWVGYELNPAYHALIAARTQQQGLFVKEQRQC
jgi:DNA modification methylase